MKGEKMNSLKIINHMLTTHFKTIKVVIHVENTADSVLCTSTNNEWQFPNRKYVLRECTSCTSIAIPGVEIGSSNRAQMLTYNIYMNHFTCSHHGILIRKKTTTYLDTKLKS